MADQSGRHVGGRYYLGSQRNWGAINDRSGQPDRRARLDTYFVYILWFCKDRSRYIGHCRVLLRRMRDHLNGKVAYTKCRRPFKLIYVEVYRSQKEAIDREKFLKSRSGRRYLDKMLNG